MSFWFVEKKEKEKVFDKKKIIHFLPHDKWKSSYLEQNIAKADHKLIIYSKINTCVSLITNNFLGSFFSQKLCKAVFFCVYVFFLNQNLSG